MARVTIDRIEESFVLCLFEGIAFEVPKALLPFEVREGDRVDISFSPAPESSDEARRATAERRARLSAQDDGGDFSL